MTQLIPPVNGIGPGLYQVAAEHPDMVMLVADNNGGIPGFSLYEKFPGRAFDLGIAEQNMVMTAAGLAASGKMPFAMGIANFVALRCSEQIRTFVAHTRLNVKLIGFMAGLSAGKEGPTHESTEDLAHMRSVPGLVVLAPADAVAAEKAVLAAAEWQGPVYLRIGRMPSAVIYDASYRFRVGKAEVHRDGTDAAILSTGNVLPQALGAAEMLAGRGINVRVLDLQTVKPLDEEAVVAAARETGAIVTVEEHTTIGGLGGAVAELLSGTRPTPVVRVGLEDVYSETGRPEELMAAHGLTAESIARSVLRAMEIRG